MKKSSLKKKKLPSISKIKRQADSVFSKWVRNQGAVDGYNWCYTCLIKLPVSELQAGHYVSRACMALRYDEGNVKPQCVGCNIFRKGNISAFALNLTREYGNEILEALEIRKNTIVKFTRKTYEDIIQKYK